MKICMNEETKDTVQERMKSRKESYGQELAPKLNGQSECADKMANRN